ncbi:MAG: hypothetical protein ACYS5F_12540 [Planctomycetota bacterium]
MNKSLFIVFVLAFLVSSSYAKYSGGDGSAEHPYRIDTAADMQEIGATSGDWNKHFLMVNDINWQITLAHSLISSGIPQRNSQVFLTATIWKYQISRTTIQA